MYYTFYKMKYIIYTSCMILECPNGIDFKYLIFFKNLILVGQNANL